MLINEYKLESIAEDYVGDLEVEDLENIIKYKGVDFDSLKDFIISSLPEQNNLTFEDIDDETVEQVNSIIIECAQWNLNQIKSDAMYDLTRDIEMLIDDNYRHLDNYDLGVVFLDLAHSYIKSKYD